MGVKIRPTSFVGGGGSGINLIISSSTPDTVPTDAVTAVTLAGVGFDPAAILSISGVGVTVGITSQNPTQIVFNATVPAGTAYGLYTLTVTNPDLSAATWPLLVSDGFATTLFSDNFNRADTVRGLGPNYVTEYAPANAFAYDGSLVQIFSNQFQQVCNTATAQLPGYAMFPRATLNDQVFGKDQFAQITFVSSAPGNIDFFWLMCRGSFVTRDFVGYLFRIQGANMEMELVSMAAAIVNETLLASTPCVAGDVVRGEVLAGAASNTIGLIVNGVLRTSVVDVDAARPVQIGSPALAFFNAVNGNVADLDNFSCGLGTQFI